jgi:large subunit ribosomal protein L10
MERSQKQQIVASLRQIFDQATVVVVTRQLGLTVAEATELRGQMRQAGATFRVTKNRLARIALDGTPYAALADMFSGSAAIAFSDDPVAAAKAAVGYANKNGKLVVIGGALREKVLDAAGVNALARLPSLDQLRAMIASLVQAPATRVAGTLQAPAGQLARVLGARATMGEAG